MINYNQILDEKNIQLHHIDTNSFALRMKTDNNIKDLKFSKVMFDFSKLDKKHELLGDKKVIGKFKRETPNNI